MVKTAKHSQYDLIIIGAGPIGINCAIEAKKAGLHYLVIEKGVLVNSLFNFPTNMTFFSTSKLLEIGEVPFISHTEKPTRRESLEYFRRVVSSWNLNCHFYEAVEAVHPLGNEHYEVKTSRRSYRTQNVIVATGFYDTPRLLNIPGEDLPKVKHYYDEPHKYVGQKVVVIGAANSGCDVALETWQKGAEVSMVVRKESISPRVKYWIKPNIENRIKEGSIKAYFNSTVREIHPHHVIVDTPDGAIELENDFVLAMTGYQPNYSFFEKIGLSFDNEHKVIEHDPETLETHLPNVYIAGVINSGMQTSKLFIENTRVHAAIIVQSILAKRSVQVG
ncbi:MAG: YpdA family putative bacillithiol disulfide reductase [Bacteroidota bacterium]